MHPRCIRSDPEENVQAQDLNSAATQGGKENKENESVYHEGASTDLLIREDDWCVVEYDGKLFSGEVRSIQDNIFEVSAVVKSGMKNWRWPAREDKIMYTKDKIKKNLNSPILVNSCDHYTFTFL